ncbi:MAG: CoA transferase [Desulfobulbaceae bacterium]|nr:MAG: CoA transferase [Desulfobulbaceae bacterium]
MNPSSSFSTKAIAASLDGVKVLDISRLLPGPYCSMILADHGAEVIAVEDKRFLADDLFFSRLYRNKRHINLNLKTEEGLEIFYQLADQSDVIIEGFRPGVAARLGVDYETLNARNPRIIYCAISGYGQTGPMRDLAGHDVNYLSMAGILDLIGPESGPPAIPGVQFGDIAGGSMNALAGILLALFARERIGKGQFVDISMTDGLLGYHTLARIFAEKNNREPIRSAELLSHRYGCYNTYRTRDNRAVAVGAVERRFWASLCTVLGVEEYIGLQYDEESREEIITRFTTLFLEQDSPYWQQLFDKHDVCCSLIQTGTEVLDHPLFIERNMLEEVKNPDGETYIDFGIPVKLSDTPGSVRKGPDCFGGSTAAVLSELGYDASDIERFRKNEVI